MDSNVRRLTIFPRTGNGVENPNSINGKGRFATPSAPKRKFSSENVPVDLKLPKPAPTLRAKRQIFTPLDEDPGKRYRCIHSVDPEGEKPYCLAQEIVLDVEQPK